MLKLILTGTALMLLPGILVLIIILIVKKKKSSGGKETAASIPTVNPADPYANRAEPPPVLPVPEAEMPGEGSRRERTVMLTYTTLILKEKDRPVRMYKADLLEPVYIGRDKTNTIRLSDVSVSRRHLKVFRIRGLCYAENLSHANGTKLNGRYLTEPKEILSGDLLELGRMKFLVEID